MKYLSILAILLTGSLKALGCNSCACASNTGSFSFGSQVDKTLIAMRCESRSLTTTHPVNLLRPDIDNHSTEQIIRFSAFGQYILKKRMILAMNIPYLVNSQESEMEDYNQKVSGTGDISFYTGWSQPVFSDSLKLRSMRFRVIGGLKLPTSKDKGPEVGEGLVAPILQRGTGSIDVNVILSTSVQLNKWQISGQYTCWMNGKSNDEYKYGRTQIGQIEVLRNISTRGNLSVQPFVRSRFLHSTPNQWKDEEIEFTGGHVFDAAPGARFLWKNWMADVACSLPIDQEQADNHVINNNVWQMSITRVFNR